MIIWKFGVETVRRKHVYCASSRITTTWSLNKFASFRCLLENVSIAWSSGFRSVNHFQIKKNVSPRDLGYGYRNWPRAFPDEGMPLSWTTRSCSRSSASFLTVCVLNVNSGDSRCSSATVSNFEGGVGTWLAKSLCPEMGWRHCDNLRCRLES